MAHSTLNGLPLLSGTVTLPRQGVWLVENKPNIDARISEAAALAKAEAMAEVRAWMRANGIEPPGDGELAWEAAKEEVRKAGALAESPPPRRASPWRREALPQEVAPGRDKIPLKSRRSDRARAGFCSAPGAMVSAGFCPSDATAPERASTRGLDGSGWG